MSRLLITAMVLLALAVAVPAPAQQADPAGARAVEVRVIEHDEFRWGDAAIGALAGAGLVALCAGVIVSTDRRRRSVMRPGQRTR